MDLTITALFVAWTAITAFVFYSAGKEKGFKLLKLMADGQDKIIEEVFKYASGGKEKPSDEIMKELIVIRIDQMKKLFLKHAEKLDK